MKTISFVLSVAAVALLCACGGGSGGGSSVPSFHPVTTTIPKDDVSDLNTPQPTDAMSDNQIQAICSASCAPSNLVERDDLMSVAFDRLSHDVRYVSFRTSLGIGSCALNLKYAGGVAVGATYDKWDSSDYADPKNPHFKVGNSHAAGDYCVPNGSVWEKLDATTRLPDQILHLRRVDNPSEVIWVSTFHGWKGTLMAKESAIFHPMACP